jgi:hypothetical protein
MKTRTRLFQIAAAIVTTAAIAAASGGNTGGGNSGGGNPPNPTGTPTVVPGQLLIRESFGYGPTSSRPTGGKGVMKVAGTGFDIGSFWAEFPGNNTMIWSTPGGKGTQGWNFSCSSVNPKETPSPLDNALCSNGTATMSAPAGVPENPAALLPFTPPSIPYEVSIDVVQQPRTSADWVGVGFTSSNALNQNLESGGQAWIRVKLTDANVDPYHFTAELHTNGLSGPSVSTQEFMGGFDTMTVRYDPIGKTVTGLYNGVVFGVLPYTAAPINHVGFEAAGVFGIITVDNFQVKASN